jgi:TonB family protein
MTPGERLGAAIAVSLACHYGLFAGWPAPRHATGADLPMVVELTGAEAGLSLAAPISLETAEPAAPAADNPADRRRAALAEYLDALTEAVHARRALRSGHLLGNARVRITVAADGRFSAIAPELSSGDAALDADALDAVAAASGAVPRPRELGDAPFTLSLTVKYQFSL